VRLLLDTHVFLWWINDSPRLSETAKAFIVNPNNDLFLSAASGWEMAIKTQLGKLQIAEDIEYFVAEQMALNNIYSLPVTMIHALHVQKLPLLHRDPFDRLLIAQSQLEKMPVLTIDSIFGRYDVEIRW
jgi:PIN domain nuclease of toxin-antitoxin system